VWVRVCEVRVEVKKGVSKRMAGCEKRFGQGYLIEGDRKTLGIK